MTLLCDVDIDEWQSTNRIPLFPEKSNEWVLAVLNDEQLTDNEVIELVYDGFAGWFDSSFDLFAAIDNRAKFGDADNVTVNILKDGKFPTENIIAKKEDLSPIPLLSSGNVMLVKVAFDYRGNVNSMPWPVMSVGLLNRFFCPVDCTIVAQVVYGATRDVAPIKGDGEVIGEILNNAATTVSDSISTPLYVAAGVTSLVAISYLASKVK